MSPDMITIARSLRFRLEVNRLFGWEVPLPVAARGALSGGSLSSPAEASPEAPEATDLEAERARRRALLAEIDRAVRTCDDCGLWQGRTQTVFGVGDPCARLLFVGEGPGYDEDRIGEPFVGKAGKLLDRMIAAMGWTRSQVYIANVVKCRPPDNRTPAVREVIACLPHLVRQIEVIQPEVICTLGNTPARALLQTTESITRLRGRFSEYRGIPVLPTFHPAYLLRNPQDKRLVWEDLQKVLKKLGRPVPRQKR